MAKKSRSYSILTVLAGILLFLFGGGLDLTGIGAPAGLTANAIGVLLIIAGLGYGASKGAL